MTEENNTLDFVRLESRLKPYRRFIPGTSDDLEIAQLEQLVTEQALSGATRHDLDKILSALEEEHKAVYKEKEEAYIEQKDNLWQRIKQDLGAYLNTHNPATIFAIEAIPFAKLWNGFVEEEEADTTIRSIKNKKQEDIDLSPSEVENYKDAKIKKAELEIN